MTENDRVTGIAWRFKGFPTLEAYKVFMAKRPMLAIVFKDGFRDHIDLEAIPHSPGAPDDFFSLLGSVRIGDVSHWDAPEEVEKLWLRIEGKGDYWLNRAAFTACSHDSGIR